MSSFNGGLPTSTLSWPGLCGVVTILALTCIYLTKSFGNDAEEPAVDYEVPIPEQCKPGWRGEELDEVQLKVYYPFHPSWIDDSSSASEADSRPTSHPARAPSNATVRPPAVLSAS